VSSSCTPILMTIGNHQRLDARLVFRERDALSRLEHMYNCFSLSWFLVRQHCPVDSAVDAFRRSTNRHQNTCIGRAVPALSHAPRYGRKEAAPPLVNALMQNRGILALLTAEPPPQYPTFPIPPRTRSRRCSWASFTPRSCRRGSS